jgi:hypothetical protein
VGGTVAGVVIAGGMVIGMEFLGVFVFVFVFGRIVEDGR